MSEPELVTDADDPLVSELVERQYRWRIRFRYDDEAVGRAAARDLVLGLLPDSRLLRTPVGFLWLGPDGEHTSVYDIGVADAVDVLAGVATLRDLAAGLAGAPLAASMLPGEPAREAFVVDAGFALVAANLRLDVSTTVPGEELADRAQVTPMSHEELANFRAGAVATYAASREEAGESVELARSTAEASFAEMFPGGSPGEGHHLFTVRQDGHRAGLVWVCDRWPDQAWVYDVEVDPAFRGRGLGAAAMVHAARWTREQGRGWLGLNVFGPNRHARALYERLGYVLEEEHHARDR